jgi:DNA repair protein RadC
VGQDRTEELTQPPEAAAAASVISPGSTRLKDLRKEDLPRERFLAHGEQALSNAELLALFFGTGTQGLNVLEMSKALLAKYGHSLQQLSRAQVPELTAQKGIGEAKAIHLAAALALGRRMAAEHFLDHPVDTPSDVANLLGPEMRMLAKESLRVVLMTTRFTLLSVQEIHRGTVNEVLASIPDILRPVITHSAFAFTLVHNHPSGDPTPSNADRHLTRRVKEAADLMNLRFLDHVILGQPTSQSPHGYFSFREQSLL